ncbi:hypothetical protein B0H16DRAFT_1701944 [Mycena metata]|uniref:Uncharacterized protein n=1 Tax=Mycena metata TaxID=1033252 RepID=A0AAD7H8N7_9AGAR|nr:hypothetical protein B0H16DRAFT_1701944 [Mycena metata]
MPNTELSRLNGWASELAVQLEVLFIPGIVVSYHPWWFQGCRKAEESSLPSSGRRTERRIKECGRRPPMQDQGRKPSYVLVLAELGRLSDHWQDTHTSVNQASTQFGLRRLGGPLQEWPHRRSLTNTAVKPSPGSNQRDFGLKYLVSARRSQSVNAAKFIAVSTVMIEALGAEFSLLFSAASARVESNGCICKTWKDGKMLRPTEGQGGYIKSWREERMGREGERSGDAGRRALRWTRADAEQRSAQERVGTVRKLGLCTRGLDADAHNVDGGTRCAHTHAHGACAASASLVQSALDSTARAGAAGNEGKVEGDGEGDRNECGDSTRTHITVRHRRGRAATMSEGGEMETRWGGGEMVDGMGLDAHARVQHARALRFCTRPRRCVHARARKDEGEGEGGVGEGEGRDEDGRGDAYAQGATHSREPDWTARVYSVRVGTAAEEVGDGQHEGGGMRVCSAATPRGNGGRHVPNAVEGLRWSMEFGGGGCGREWLTARGSGALPSLWSRLSSSLQLEPTEATARISWQTQVKILLGVDVLVFLFKIIFGYTVALCGLSSATFGSL